MTAVKKLSAKKIELSSNMMTVYTYYKGKVRNVLYAMEVVYFVDL